MVIYRYYICIEFNQIRLKKAQLIIVFLLRLKIHLAAHISTKWAASMAFKIFCTPYRKPSTYKPPVFQKAEEFQINVEGTRIHGYSWKNNLNGPIALIVHGFESRAYNFDRYINPLLKNGYQVYAMDAKAHGKSGGKTITVPEYVEMIYQLEKKIGKIEAFLSHSFGGLATAMFQDKYNNPSAKLVLIAPATETTSALDLFCRFFRLGKEVRDAIYRLILDKSGKEASYLSIKRVIPTISNPVLWIHDRDDEITPLSDVTPLLEANLPHIEFMITEGLGHRKIYKENAVVKKVIAFLER